MKLIKPALVEEAKKLIAQGKQVDVSHLNTHPTKFMETIDELADYVRLTGDFDMSWYTGPKRNLSPEEHQEMHNIAKQWYESNDELWYGSENQSVLN